MSSRDRETPKRVAAAVLSIAALTLLTLLAVSRDSLGRVSGDEGTYLAMAESLVRDLDLEFGDADEERLTDATEPGRRTIILQRTPAGISYSKPVLPALLTAPLVAILGSGGFFAANLLLLAAALGLLWIYLRREGGSGSATLTVVTVAAAGTLLPYAMWRTSDVLQASLAMAGLVLCLAGIRATASSETVGDLLSSRWAPRIGIILLGLLIALRPPYVLLAGIVPLASAMRGRWKGALRSTAGLAATLLVMATVSWSLVGTAMPYKAERATFNAQTGYPAGDDLEVVSEQFEKGRATSSLGVLPDFRPRVSAPAAAYFLVGRHTGILAYFPAALFLVLAAMRKTDRVGVAVLLGVAATSVFFLLWLPFNYFGGGSCIGNRYFLACYAALPLALTRPLRSWALTGSWLVALLVGGSALASERLPANVDESSQSHVHAGIFRMLPYETTASDIEGSRDRYFGKDFVRSVDPFVEAEPWSFRLDSQKPPAEFILANLERDEPLRLLLHSETSHLELVYSDRRLSTAVTLASPVDVKGYVELQPTPPNRFHPLWFRNPWDHGRPYWVRVFRLTVRGPDGAPARATLRFLGNEEFPATPVRAHRARRRAAAVGSGWIELTGVRSRAQRQPRGLAIGRLVPGLPELQDPEGRRRGCRGLEDTAAGGREAD